MLLSIKKRNGSIVDFVPGKIQIAIKKALDASGSDTQEYLRLANKAITLTEALYENKTIPTVENIQDLVEQVLIAEGFGKTAKCYILYREKRARMRDGKSLIKDAIDLINSYIDEMDWKVKENSNMGYSLQGLNNYISSKITSLYWLNNVYDEDVSKAHSEGRLHIHDRDALSSYCCGWNLEDLLELGLSGVPGKIESKPARHFHSALGHIVNYFYTLQGESAGAQAFSNFDTLLAPFIKYDGLSYEQVKQCLQTFIFNINVPTRVGFQCMSEDTQILTKNGWKSHSEVAVDDIIATYNIEKESIEYLPVKKKFAREYKGKMYHLKSRDTDQLISPKHRIVRRTPGSKKIVLEEIEKCLNYKTGIIIPKTTNGLVESEINIDQIKLKLMAWLISEGSGGINEKDIRICIYQSSEKHPEYFSEIKEILNSLNYTYEIKEETGNLGQCDCFRICGKDSRIIIDELFDGQLGIKRIPEKLLSLNREDSLLFLKTYCKGNGEYKERFRTSTVSEEIKNGLMQIGVNAGFGVTEGIRLAKNLNPKINKKDVYQLSFLKAKTLCVKNVKEVDYEGIIWCPNTDNETVIARRNNKVFITGNTPFTNVTLDLEPPSYLANMPVIIGGERREETYSEFQNEMNMFNKAFCEVMMEGDAKGRLFTFPIPTYNITKDFNWDNPDIKIIWEMTAKYGIPYFANFVNSDMSVEDARSMCLSYDTEVRVKFKNRKKCIKIQIGKLLENNEINDFEILTSQGYRPISRKIIKEVDELVEIELESGKKLKMSLDHPHLIHHKKGLHIVWAKDLEVGMEVSCRHDYSGENNPMYGQKGRISGDKNPMKIESVRKKVSLALQGNGNPMYGKSHSLESKQKISENCKDHFVSDKCRQLSSERWKGLNNPVASQEYWDRKDFNENNMQISKIEKVVYDFLDIQQKDFEFQKVFHYDDKTLVADFFIPSKNLVVECESRIKETTYNDFSYNNEKHSIYEKMGLNLLVTNPCEDSIWVKHLNKTEKIIKINKIKKKQLVYDIEILDVEGKSKTHDFYANDILTHNCCRLRLDNRELRKRGGGLFASNPMTGSIGVVTINLPRLAYESNGNKEVFFVELDELLLLARQSLLTKRKLLENLTDKGLYPYARFYLKKVKQGKKNQYWSNHFNTIGVLGMNEACLNMFGENITSKIGKDFAIETLEYVRDRMEDFQEEDGTLYNLEATPGEGTSYRFARIDKKQYPSIITAGKEEPYYTNSSHLPVGYTDNIFEALEHQDELQTLYTGGTVLHGFIGEKIDDSEICKKLVKKISENFSLPYFTITPTFSVCPVHGYIRGEHHTCNYIQTQNIKEETYVEM